MGKTVTKSKYLRRYRICFIIGIVLLAVQVLFIASFLAQNRSGESGNVVVKENKAERPPDHSTNHAAQASVSGNRKPTSNLTAIKLEDLEFNLPCHITGREALSAINRARTQKCKQLIANITCLSLENKLYPSKLKSSCPAGNFEAGKPLGCFKDESGFRLLTGYFLVNKQYNSPAYCTRLCLQSGFPYAGVEYGNECFCGADEPPSSSKIADSSCNMKCSGDAQETCGGYFAINIFQTGIKKFVPQMAHESASPPTKPVKIVFLLTLNGRALRQVIRLIKLIYHKDHYYFIHVDVRQDYLFRELLVLEEFPNIRLTRKRFATIWGGASLLEMLRSCMFELLNIKDWDWQYVLNLSESDYPVKTIEKLTSFLSGNKERNFVKSHGREVQRFIQKQGLDKTFVECETRMWRVGNRELPLGIQIDGGSDWVALSRKFIEFVANPEPVDLVSGLLQIFTYTLLPAESFFHTVLRNSKFCNTYVDNNLHVTNWKRKLGCKCQYKHVVDWCGCSPNDFRPDDWTKILNTLPRPIYFARKFEPVINQAVILQLELWLFGLEKPSKEVPNLNSYWQNIFHHKDTRTSADDALMTFSHSIRRIFLNSSSCNVIFEKLLEVTSFYKNDEYKNTLFLFNTSYGHIEVAVKPIDKLVVLAQSELTKSIVSMFISTDYDQKEQLSRNVLRVMSPYSEPVLVYNFDMRKIDGQYNLTCLWIDPVGTLRDVSGFSVDENSPVGFVKPNLKQPHLPGIWEVKILHKSNLILQLTFLITPIQFLYGSEIEGPQLSFLYSGLKQASSFGDSYLSYLPNVTEKEVLSQTALDNSYRKGDSLFEWIDSLVSTFYSVDKFCGVASEQIKQCGNALENCVRTSWSSFAPDPKSAMSGKVNASTGMFAVW